ncbi:MAG: hypothetical protein QW334_00305 [Thermofilum sp.]
MMENWLFKTRAILMICIVGFSGGALTHMVEDMVVGGGPIRLFMLFKTVFNTIILLEAFLKAWGELKNEPC